jgi:hypothetical protein
MDMCFMKTFKFFALVVAAFMAAGPTNACGMHGLYDFGSPVYTPKCLRTDGEDGFCGAAMPSSRVNKNSLDLSADSAISNMVADSTEEVGDADDNGAVCVMDAECDSGKQCVKPRGRYGICK